MAFDGGGSKVVTRFFTARRVAWLVAGGLLGALSLPFALPQGRGEWFASGVVTELFALVCLVPVLVAVHALRPKLAFAGGLLAGMAYFNGAFWWINIAMTTFGGMPNALSIPVLELLAFWCALFWGAAFGLARLFEQKLGWRMGWTIAPLWMALELLRNYALTGFPWASLGYTQSRHLWFSQVASLVGVYGLAFIVALVNGALFELYRARKGGAPMPKALLAAAAGLLVAGNIFGAIRVRLWEAKLAAAPKIDVAVVQGNIDQKLKNVQGGMWRTVMSRYNPPTSAADAHGAELIVWPEAAFPRAFPSGVASVAGAGLSQAAYQGHLLLGVDVYNPSDLRRGNENAAFLVRPDLTVVAKHAKYHLVPFGEYVPLNLDQLLPIDNVVPGTFVPGASLEPLVFESRGKQVRVGPEICYDALFPEISREFAARGANLLVNLTNDAWYGHTGAPYQFLRIVQMRAVETGRSMARAANTGISALIDPLGRIREPTPVGIVDGDQAIGTDRLSPPEWRMAALPLIEEQTVYTRLGDMPAYAAALFSLAGIALCIAARKRV